MLYGKPVLDAEGETAVTIAQHGAVDRALAAGMNVIVDDTNFFARSVRSLMKIAYKNGAEVEFKDFTDVPLEECLRRDDLRRQAGQSNLSGAVGEKVIRGMHDRYIKGRTLPLSIPDVPKVEVEPYDNLNNLPPAIIVDIDGTLATMSDRSPYEWHRVGEDAPVDAVIKAVRAAAYSNEIIVMSGRDESCRSITENWLVQNLGVSFYLYMRPENDQRQDDIVKYELFNNNVRDKYHVNYVLDDRDQVVRMWRKLGLNCFQVNYGDF
jgi:hypothetical protein